MRPRLLVPLTIASIALAFDCNQPISLDKSQFNLNSISGVHKFETSVSTPPTTTKTAYSLSLCSPLKPEGEDDCPEGTNLCMIVSTSRAGLEDRVISVVPIARLGDDAPKASRLEGGDDASKGFIMELAGGEYNSISQSAKIEMICDKDATETAPTFKDYDAKNGVLQLKYITAAACPINGENPPPTSPPDSETSPKESSGHSYFFWFFVLFFFGLFAYFVLGTFNNNQQYGATGWDAIPHRDFWRDVPYVVSDLFKGRGSNRSGYSTLG